MQECFYCCISEAKVAINFEMHSKQLKLITEIALLFQTELGTIS